MVGMQQTLGSKHPHTLTAMSNLAGALKVQGKLDEATELSRLSWEGEKENTGGMHPSTLTAMGNFAQMLHAQGKLHEAEKMYRGAFEGMKKIDHPHTGKCLTKLMELMKLLRVTKLLETVEAAGHKSL